jgi:hypothetical protein
LREYVLTIAVRDSERPLADEVLIEAGQSEPARFAEAVANVGDMLRVLGSPEKVASFMRDNAPTQRLVMPGTLKGR